MILDKVGYETLIVYAVLSLSSMALPDFILMLMFYMYIYIQSTRVACHEQSYPAEFQYKDANTQTLRQSIEYLDTWTLGHLNSQMSRYLNNNQSVLERENIYRKIPRV